MAGNVIKEFMVSLGISTDEGGFRRFDQSIKRFDEGIKNVSRSTALLREAVEAIASTAVIAGLRRTAETFEQIHYSGERAGASTAGVAKWSFAAGQAGISAQQWIGTLEGLGQRLRTMPGMQGFIAQMLHVRTAGKDNAELMGDVLDRLSKMHPAIARMWGDMLGIDENVIQQFRLHGKEIRQWAADYSKRLKDAGISQKDLDTSTVEFMNSLRQLGAQFSILLLGVFAGNEKWMTTFVHSLTDGVHWMSEINRETGGWAGTLVVLGSSILGVGAALKVLRGILGLVGLGGGAAAAAGGAAAGGGGLAGLLRFLAPAAAGAVVVGGAAGAASGHPELWESVKDAVYQLVTGKERRPGAGGGAAGGGPALSASDDARLSQLITAAEGTRGAGGINYNEVFGFGKFGRPSKPPTEMTLAEVLAYGQQLGEATRRAGIGVKNGQVVGTSAVGGYQIEARSTMLEAARALGLDMNTTKFTPDVQERMKRWILQTEGPTAWQGVANNPRLLAAAEALMRPARPAAGGLISSAQAAELRSMLAPAMRSTLAPIVAGGGRPADLVAGIKPQAMLDALRDHRLDLDYGALNRHMRAVADAADGLGDIAPFTGRANPAAMALLNQHLGTGGAGGDVDNSRDVSIVQNVNVQGGGVLAAGGGLEGVLRRSNADLLRNMQGAIR